LKDAKFKTRSGEGGVGAQGWANTGMPTFRQPASLVQWSVDAVARNIGLHEALGDVLPNELLLAVFLRVIHLGKLTEVTLRRFREANCPEVLATIERMGFRERYDVSPGAERGARCIDSARRW